MKNLTVTFKESKSKQVITANDWNEFSHKLFLITPISFIEDVEDMEDVFNNGFENNFIKIIANA